VNRDDPRDVRFLRHLYDAVIRQMDGAVLDPLLDHLESLGLENDTLVVFTSDHGEAFGEHGAFLHSDLYTETLRVPLILRFPHRLPADKRVVQRVGVIDVMPTILDVLGIPAPPTLQGRSLLPLVVGDVAAGVQRDVASEYSSPSDQRVLQSVRHGDVTYIVDRDAEQLFDHAADPAEQVNVAAERPQELASARSALARWREECRRLAPDFGPKGAGVAPSAETLQRLRALGYVD
jgi:arylsulfatase A-like enzyme